MLRMELRLQRDEGGRERHEMSSGGVEEGYLRNLTKGDVSFKKN